DIGSGMGTFLHAAKPYYKNLVGLDVSEKMAAFVEKTVGIKVYISQYENFEWKMPFHSYI
ncbi:MAG TPA: methyltransferase domain-containing protein, partial [Chitinophagaceae bacterium]|nr:methyltransferase domain-containing protein [Chitinophagaceae bacterium]